MTKKLYDVTGFRLDEIAAVDRPAQAEARKALLKRAKLPMAMEDDEECSTGKKPGKKTKPAKGVTKAETSADGHGACEQTAGDVTEEGASEDLGQAADTDMPETKAPAADDKSKVAEAQVAELTKKLDRATKWGDLGDAERALAKAMNPADQDAFLALKPEERADRVRKAAEADAVVYTATDGTTFRKSDDARLVAMAKRADDTAKALAKAQDEARDAQFAKRAQTELSHLPGDTSAHVALLKAVDGIADETLRTKAIAALKANNAEMATAFRTVGDKSEGSTDANDQLDTLAKRYQEAHKGTSFAKAYDAVLQTAEGQRLYQQFTDARRGRRN